MNCNIILIVLVALVLYSIMSSSSEKKEGFRTIDTTAAPTQTYYRHPMSPYQINQYHHPFYNWPQYIGKYPYYHYMFHPYNSRVYYT